MTRLLVIDNYDSFTYNLVQMFRHYPIDIGVFRSDRISIEAAEKFKPAYILISPGPKGPGSCRHIHPPHQGLLSARFRFWASAWACNA